VKTVGVRPAEWQQKKKFIFFLRSFPERMFREVNGGRALPSTLRGIKSKAVNEIFQINKLIKTRLRPFGKPPNVHYSFIIMVGELVP
jgi:hypothetical protein